MKKDNIIKLIFIIMIIYSNSFSAEKELDVSGIITLDNLVVKDNLFNKLQSYIKLDKSYNNWGINAALNYSYTNEEIYNNIIDDSIPPQEYFEIEELYGYIIKEDLILNIGVLPFKRGTFSNYSWNKGYIGNGLFTIVDIPLQGLILAYNNPVYGSIALGYIWHDEFIKTKYILNDVNGGLLSSKTKTKDIKGSNGPFMIYRKKLDKFLFEFNYFRLNLILNNIKLTTSNILGTGLAWDDISDSGLVIYSILTGSTTKGDSSVMNPSKTSYINDEYHLGKIDTSGYSFLLGSKYYIDNSFIPKELSIGFEYFTTSPGNITLNTGKPYNMYGYANYGNTYNIWTELRCNKNFDIILRGMYYDNNDINLKYGGVTETTTNLKDVDNSNKTMFILQFQYNF